MLRRAALRAGAPRAELVRARWHAWRGRNEPPVVALDQVRRRLECLLAALYDRPVRVEALTPPAPPGVVWRVVDGVMRVVGGGGRATDMLARVDGDCVRLPAAVHAEAGPEAAVAHYRLLALQQAERLVRGTAAWAPADGDLLVRDLFHVAEGAAVDAAIAARAPGARPALAVARREALAARFAPGALGGVPGAVERLAQQVLAAEVGATTGDVPAAARPEHALAWAQTTAAALRAGMPGDRYRGMLPVHVWGAAPVGAGDPGRVSAAGAGARAVARPEEDGTHEHRTAGGPGGAPLADDPAGAIRSAAGEGSSPSAGPGEPAAGREPPVPTEEWAGDVTAGPLGEPTRRRPRPTARNTPSGTTPRASTAATPWWCASPPRPTATRRGPTRCSPSTRRWCGGCARASSRCGRTGRARAGSRAATRSTSRRTWTRTPIGWPATATAATSGCTWPPRRRGGRSPSPSWST
jgi:hypothetical protein